MHRHIANGSRILWCVAVIAAAVMFRAAGQPYEAVSAGQPVRIVRSQPAAPTPDGRAKEEVIVRFFGGAPGETAGADVATILYFGDVMMSRNVNAIMEKSGEENPFEVVKTVLPLADIAVANLEGPVTERNNQPANRMVFHFSPSRAALLGRLGFDALDLANNHAYDQGTKGAEDTRRSLAEKDLVAFGEAKSETGANAAVVKARGLRVALVGFQDVTRSVDVAAAAKAVAKAKQSADLVIVSFHGGVEYRHEATDRQRMLARAAIDAGSDAVISHHPHVVEGIEVYKNRPIFFSLGNFIFDQYFSEDTQQGLGVLLSVEGGVRRFSLLPIKSVRSQVRTMTDDERKKFLEDLAGWSASELRADILRGVLTFPL
ncbi:MAG: CapA family protein [Patescibacteria group bacterium]